MLDFEPVVDLPPFPLRVGDKVGENVGDRVGFSVGDTVGSVGATVLGFISIQTATQWTNKNEPSSFRDAIRTFSFVMTLTGDDVVGDIVGKDVVGAAVVGSYVGISVVGSADVGSAVEGCFDTRRGGGAMQKG